jgi:hypothetical protein
MWEELVSLMSTVSLVEKDDELVWQFTSSGVYSSHSLYNVVNFLRCDAYVYSSSMKTHNSS